MSKRSAPLTEASYFSSGKTVVSNSGTTYNIKRDDNGDYNITNNSEDATVFIGDAATARTVLNALEALLDENDEE